MAIMNAVNPGFATDQFAVLGGISYGDNRPLRAIQFNLQLAMQLAAQKGGPDSTGHVTPQQQQPNSFCPLRAAQARLTTGLDI